MKIHVVDLYGKTYTIDGINDTTTVEALKFKIQAQSGLPIDQQRIIFTGKQLEDHRTLASYEVQEESKLTLVLRLIGD
jgi:hypothetical protein